MTTAENFMVATWERLCTTPGFSHPGFTCEVSPDGKVIMSPTSNDHGWYQARLSILFAQIAQPFVELAVLTSDGLFEVDVAWSRNFSEIRKQKFASPAPEICVEVEPESDTPAEFERKRRALFSAGCNEVWIVTPEGKLSFYDASGVRERSSLIPSFTSVIEG